MMPRRSTLSDANARRPERIFKTIYCDLYGRYRKELSSDSRTRRTAKWMHRLQILDSTTITLFSNLIFMGAGRHPKHVKKKGGINVHAVINANEGIPCDVMHMNRDGLMEYRIQHVVFTKRVSDSEDIEHHATSSLTLTSRGLSPSWSHR